MSISLPNQLALLRIVLVPIVMVLVLRVQDEPAILGALLFVVAAFTDFLDGYIARRRQQTTIMGAFLDSTADKLLVTGALLALLAVDRVSVWAALIIIVREFVVMALRGLTAIEGELVRPSVWGKLKAGVQFLAMALAMLRLGEPIGPFYLDEWVMWAAVAITVSSGWEYVSRFWNVARRVDAVDR